MNISIDLINRTMDLLGKHMTARGLSRKTRKSYLSSVHRFLLWQQVHWSKIEKNDHNWRMEAFISSLANDRKRPILFSTQKSYFNALIYFYREFQKKDVRDINAVRAKRSQRIFDLLTSEQLKLLFENLTNAQRENYGLMAKLMFGTGMRLDEAIKLRVKDIRFEEGLIAVQEGKGDKAGLADMPNSLKDELRKQIDYARTQFDLDRSLKRNGVYLPNGLSRKYPAYSTSWEWYWLFPHWNETYDDDGTKRRHHINDYLVSSAFRETRRRVGLPEHTTAHMMRHCYATFYLKNLIGKIRSSGIDMPDLYGFCRDSLRKKLRHVSAETTDIYIHLAMDRNEISDASPMDLLK